LQFDCLHGGMARLRTKTALALALALCVGIFLISTFRISGQSPFHPPLSLLTSSPQSL
jgi:uncharacterized membrane protein